MTGLLDDLGKAVTGGGSAGSPGTVGQAVTALGEAVTQGGSATTGAGGAASDTVATTTGDDGAAHAGGPVSQVLGQVLGGGRTGSN